MPLLHLRVCPCGDVRFASCGASCLVPSDQDPASWRDNMQDGAGTLPPGIVTPIKQEA